MPPIGRLLALPVQQIEAIVSEGLAAFRGASPYRDVPPLEPTLGLLGGALLDRTFTLSTSVMTGVPLPEKIRQTVAEIEAARAFYESRGWLADPLGYHQPPPPLEEVELDDEVTWSGPRRQRYRHLHFPSGFAPHPGEPGCERWVEHPRNGTAHAYVLAHPEPRPWLVCVHGFGMGQALVNLSAFPIAHLHEKLGLNLLMPVLPLHGPRSAARVSGGEVLTPDFMQMVHLFAQAAWDLRRMISWVRRSGGARVGLYGISLGGYAAALVAGLEDQLDCVIAGIPAVDFPSLARANEPWMLRRVSDELQVDWRHIRAVTHVVSPLALPVRLPRERLFIYAGIADRVIRPDQPRALWLHWDRPEIHWFSGGHVLGVKNSGITGFLESSLAKAGMVRSPEAA